jgi:predicted nucleic acid-binding protein
MIKDCYIDTCVLAAYYCPESMSDQAEKILLTIENPIISLLTEVELFSAISKKFRKNELTKKNAQKIVAIYKAHVKEGYYQKIAIKPEHYLYAQDLLESLNYSLHSLDALHLAIAASENILLLTSDQNLAKVAKKCQTKSLLLKIKAI